MSERNPMGCMHEAFAFDGCMEECDVCRALAFGALELALKFSNWRAEHDAEWFQLGLHLDPDAFQLLTQLELSGERARLEMRARF